MTNAEHVIQAVLRTGVDNAYSAAEVIERKYPEYYVTVEIVLSEFDDSRPGTAGVTFRFVAAKEGRPAPESLTTTLAATSVAMGRVLNEAVELFKRST